MRTLLKNRNLLAGWRGFWLALVIAAAAGCAGINHLREAQTAFNQAAAADVRASFNAGATVNDTISPDFFTNWVNLRASYANALLSLNQIGGKEESILRTEKLWGTKLALEALCRWKMGDYEKATDAARKAQQCEDLYPRDRALMTALPGLIMTDHAFDLLTAQPPPPPASTDRTNLVTKAAKLLIGNAGAVEVLQSARAANLMEAEHPLHGFLLQAQLAAYRNYRTAYKLLDPSLNSFTNDVQRAAHASAQAQLDDLSKRLKDDAGANALVDRWAILDNLKNPRTAPR